MIYRALVTPALLGVALGVMLRLTVFGFTPFPGVTAFFYPLLILLVIAGGTLLAVRRWFFGVLVVGIAAGLYLFGFISGPLLDPFFR